MGQGNERVSNGQFFFRGPSDHMMIEEWAEPSFVPLSQWSEDPFSFRLHYTSPNIINHVYTG